MTDGPLCPNLRVGRPHRRVARRHTLAGFDGAIGLTDVGDPARGETPREGSSPPTTAEGAELIEQAIRGEGEADDGLRAEDRVGRAAQQLGQAARAAHEHLVDRPFDGLVGRVLEEHR